jgi:hypothetical protein
MSAPPITAWELFVLRHRHPLNLRIHFVSMCMYLVGCACFFAVLLTEQRFSWPWFALWCASGPMGAFGHWWTGDGRVSAREATHDPAVPFFVFRMFWHLARGSYAEEVRRAEEGAG